MPTAHRSSTSNRGDDRFRALFEHASVGVALCDLDGRFCDVNVTLRDLLGGTGIDPDAGGLTDLLCHTPGEADEVTEWCEGLDAVSAGRRLVARVQVNLSPPDAAPRLVQATAATVVLGERPYLLAHIEDATGRRLERQRLVHRIDQHHRGRLDVVGDVGRVEQPVEGRHQAEARATGADDRDVHVHATRLPGPLPSHRRCGIRLAAGDELRLGGGRQRVRLPTRATRRAQRCSASLACSGEPCRPPSESASARGRGGPARAE